MEQSEAEDFNHPARRMYRSLYAAAVRSEQDVPHYPQWGSPDWVRRIVEDDADPCDDPAWQRSGFTEPERYRFWAKRLCGLTCLESKLDFWEIAHAPRAALLDDALRHDVYRMRHDGGVDGLIYRPFAGWTKHVFGLDVEVLTETGIEEIASQIDADTLVIVSVSPEIRYPERPNARQGGHLILAARPRSRRRVVFTIRPAWRRIKRMRICRSIR